MQEFEGVNYKDRALAQQDMVFMEMMQDSMGKRERTGNSYNERDFHRSQARVACARGADTCTSDSSDPQKMHCSTLPLYEVVKSNMPMSAIPSIAGRILVGGEVATQGQEAS